MISTRDLENVVAQVNNRFDEINKRIERLEAAIIGSAAGKKEKPSGDKKTSKG